MASPAHQVAPVAVALVLSPEGPAELTVRLDPVELGQVEIRIERPQDGSAAQVKVQAERPETLALLQRDAPELGRALAQAGIQPEHCRMSFSLGQERQGTQPQSQGQGRRGQQRWGGAALPVEATPQPRAMLGLLDIAI